MAILVASLIRNRRGAKEASCVEPQSESGNDFKLKSRRRTELPFHSGVISELGWSLTGSAEEGRVGTHCPFALPPSPAEADSAGARVAELGDFSLDTVLEPDF
ncbi:PREDICTED: uncharacterized protein LOC105597569 [Cercocebus atys]|uniref:uncharacterized protein LOC105597569 n=1 Tax=Cercocebus atys TaxID=9531 RepID=UPI0005F48779|nr:PREDICTED: uncharacterized protein LOC105597569 [Cercocebus atys]